MKKILLLKLVFLSIFSLWTITGNSQVNEIKTNVSLEPVKAKISDNSGKATGKYGVQISPVLVKDKQTTNTVSLGEKDKVLSNSPLIPGNINVLKTETHQSSVNESNLKNDARRIDTGLIEGTTGIANDLDKIPIQPLISGSPDFPENTNIAENIRDDNNIVLAPGMNLSPYQPSGWDNKIVLSTVTGTNVSASTIYNNQTIYLDWAALNDGLTNIPQTFYSKLYVDGVLTGYYSTTGLNSNYYTTLTDQAIGPLSAGSHSFRIVVDSDANVAESNETDNEYTRTFTISYSSICANLTPFQPSGWDNKIVLSTETGTTTSSSVIYDNQAIYLDWAVINGGTCNISPTFYTKLYIDGSLIASYSTVGLTANSYAYISDAAIGSLSAGSHTFRVVADSEGNVNETNESDNEYTRTFTVSSSICSNLTPYQPSGWDNKIVLSTVTGTTTSASVIYDNQTIYFDWAAINNGTCNISSIFYTKLYVDGVLSATFITNGLTTNSYSYFIDDAIGPFSAGTHTFKLVTDSDGNLTETNESDNEYTRLFTITASPACANITPYQPLGWDDKIVLSTESGTTTSASAFYDNQTIYLDWAAINNGSCNISPTFYTELYLDGSLIATYNTPGLASNSYAYISDAAIGPLAAGSHTFRIVTDSYGYVSETNESDNEYTRTIMVSESICANLTPFQPSGWDNTIVLSTEAGTTTSASVIYDNQTIYLDWAEINDGTCNIPSTFYTKLYIDEVLTTTYYTNGLDSYYYAYVSDAVIGPLSAGSHTFRIVIDSDGNVAETNESDNEYSRTISVQQLEIADISIFPTSLTINQSSSPSKGEGHVATTPDVPVYVPKIPDYLIVSTFVDTNGDQVDIIKVPGTPPPVHREKVAVASNAAVTVSVPAFDWSFGCSATSAAMVAGYYDNNGYPNMYTGPTNGGVMPMTNASWGSVVISGETRSQCPLSATRNGVDGRTTRGHVDDYWVVSNSTAQDPYITNGWTQHTYGDCTGDFMKTNQSAFGNIDASTTFYYNTNGSPYTGTATNDGGYGFQLFLESRGYTVTNRYNQYILGYNGNTLGFSFNQYVAEIDAGRPVLIQVTNHTMVGYGYDLTGNIIYLHDTWDYSNHSMTWGGSYSGLTQYGVSVFQLAPNSPDNSFLISNVGTGNLNINSITSNKNWLSTSGYPGTPFSILPTGSQDVSVAINWTLVGSSTQTGIITIASNDPDEPSVTVQVTAVPQVCSVSAPTVGTITQPTCSVSTGSVILNGLPATGTWTLTRSPGGTTITGTGTTATITGLAAGTYTYTVTNSSGCVSASSANIVINAQPVTPTTPVVGTITQPTCSLPTGSVVLSGLPATGTWTLTRTPGGTTTTGTGTSTTITGLTAGTYTYTVTNASGCTSLSSGNVVISAVPNAPASPTVGSITQPTCSVSTGSVVLSGLPATGIWTLTRTPGGTTTTGTGTTSTITGIPSGTYTYTVTNAAGCTSPSSANVVINAAPNTPSAPTVGTITQPTCSVSTGSVVLSGLPATGTWTLTRTPGGTTTTGTGTSSTITGLAPGTYTYTVTNAAGCISASSGSVLIIAPQCVTHFTPVWSGSGMDHMNLYALTATLDNVALQPGDEIGIFDGSTCVGMGVLTQVLNGTIYLSMVASRDDPDTPLKDGYTIGNTISYKVWDSSAGSEVSNTVASYTLGVGVFAVGASSAFNLSALTAITHNLNLTTGWNIMSFASQPANMSMMSIVNPLITAATLTKVQDERGNAIEQLPAPIGWVDNIGLMKIEEGYKIKVTGNTILSVTGQPVTLPYTVALSAGWNIMGYPSMNSQGASAAFSPLITAATLIKVQDEAGNAIEQLPAPIGWIDNIINLTSGHGYKVKTTVNTSLTINSSGKGEYQNMEEPVFTHPTHFKLAYKGNGLDQMNIYLENPTVGGVDLKTGDEIGVFDRGVCVGAAVVDDPDLKYLMVIASLDDPSTQKTDGFKEGNNFDLRLWDNQSGIERIAHKEELAKGYSKQFEKLGTSVLAVDFEIVTHSSLGDAYPNPSTNKTTFTFQLEKESKVRLEIVNIEGELIKVLVDQKMTSGTHKADWDNRSASGTKALSGIYFYSLKLNNFVQTKKLVIQ